MELDKQLASPKKLLTVSHIADYLYAKKKICNTQHVFLVQLRRQSMFVFAANLHQQFNPSN